LSSVAAGSAVLSVVPADPELFEDISNRLRSLALSSGDDTSLAHTVESLGPRVRSTFGELIAAASRHNVSIFTRSRRSGAVFSRHAADRIRSALTSVTVGEAEEIELTGQFVAFNTRAASFDFIDEEDDQQYHGFVSRRLLDRTEQVIVGSGASYRVWLQLQAMRPLGAQQTTEYQLNRIELIE
jgi:hypothetical protein